MSHNSAYRRAEERIEETRRKKGANFSIIGLNKKGEHTLTELPDSLGELTQLQELNLHNNRLTVLPKSLGQLTQLQELNLQNNRLTTLPDSLGQLTQLRSLNLQNNRLTALPNSLGKLVQLESLNLGNNPLSPELAAAYSEGLDAVKRFLRARAEAGEVVLNEAKLILVGEGEVGKSCLLSALRGDPFEEGKSTTHGIQIKPVKVADPTTRYAITLNGWDFGGQRVYRPTHQLFFSAPAVYLVVWKPREGPRQNFVHEWIRLVKHREPEAKILVVATHGGPGARQPDIDRQEIWDLFGKDTVVEFFFVDSKSGQGISELKEAIAKVAGALPEVGRSVAKSWHDARVALKDLGCAYITTQQAIGICNRHKMTEGDAKLFLTIEHRLGHLIHYAHDPLLKDIVILKPDWLASAISFVLDDKVTRAAHGLASHEHLSKLWNDANREAEHRYPEELHSVFLKLMERYDLCYRVAAPGTDLHDGTSLIAQLVPDVRPDTIEQWPVGPPNNGDSQQVQICRIVDAAKNVPAAAEGLFFQLIVRLHKYSLGRADYQKSVHWQRGLVLVDDTGSHAFLEHIDTNVRISVRSPYPERFLAALTYEVKWLVETFWKGMRCDVTVPCLTIQNDDITCSGLFEVSKLIENLGRNRQDQPCSICNVWQSIEELLHNAPAARPNPLEELFAKHEKAQRQLETIHQQVVVQHAEVIGRFDRVDSAGREVVSKVEAAYSSLMHMLLDEAKDGPRLFTLERVKPRIFNLLKWIKEMFGLSLRFRLTLWCEHSRMPLSLLNPEGDSRGVYEFEQTSQWLATVIPYVKVIANTLSLVLPVASSLSKIKVSDEVYTMWEKRLEIAKKTAESVTKASEKLLGTHAPNLGENEGTTTHGADLRRLHAFLKEKDPGFGGLVRVMNRRQEFLWVHPMFEGEY